MIIDCVKELRIDNAYFLSKPSDFLYFDTYIALNPIIMKNTLISFLTLITIALGAQTPSGTFKGKFNVYPVDSLGVVLLDRNLKQLSNGDLALEFSGLDVDLKQKWKNLYPFTEGFSPVFQDISAKDIVLVFSDKTGKNYEILKANTDFGDYERFKYQFSEPVQINEIAYYYDNLWVAGSIGNYPSIFKLNSDNTYEIVPTGLPGRLKYVGELAFDKETKGLNFLMLADVNKEDVLIWRSLSLSGSVLKNEMLRGFEKSKVRSLKATYTEDNAFLAGTYSFNGRTKTDGLFFGKIGERNNGLKLNTFKSINALVRYKKLDDIASNDFKTAKLSKFKSANKTVFVDNLIVKNDGSLSVSLEVFKPEYRSRGALERQFIERDRTAQLDQNVYGRRDAFFGDVGTLDLEQRFDRYSATDQLQYRFMGQSLGKAVNQGVSYNHTAIVTLNKDLNLISSYGVSFDLIDFGTLAKSSHMTLGILKYPSKNQFKVFDLDSKKVSIVDTDEGKALLNWTSQLLLQIDFNSERSELTLSGKRFN